MLPLVSPETPDNSFGMSDLADEIEAVASGPKSVQNAGTKVDAHDLSDLIEADKYLKSQDATANPTHRGLRFNKLVPPGAG
ncbi:MAG: hypothetical protein SFX18_00520 [Pirellulales bacterium]|nr:hypothetical protein [Pirellulales bacterium]